MKDFDAERKPRRPLEDRQFTLGGEQFVIRDRFRPEVLVPLESLEDAVTDKTTCSCDHRLHQHNEGGKVGACQEWGCDCKKFNAKILSPGSSLTDQLAAIDKTITGMLEGGEDAGSRYGALRAREEDALEVPDLMAIIQWATEKDAGHPTGQPSVSTPGPEPTGTSSTEDSSSPVPAAA